MSCAPRQRLWRCFFFRLLLSSALSHWHFKGFPVFLCQDLSWTADSIRHLCCSACRALSTNDFGSFSFFRLCSVGYGSNRHSKGSPVFVCQDLSWAADSMRHVCCSACRARRANDFGAFSFFRLFTVGAVSYRHSKGSPVIVCEDLSEPQTL